MLQQLMGNGVSGATGAHVRPLVVMEDLETDNVLATSQEPHLAAKNVTEQRLKSRPAQDHFVQVITGYIKRGSMPWIIQIFLLKPVMGWTLEAQMAQSSPNSRMLLAQQNASNCASWRACAPTFCTWAKTTNIHICTRCASWRTATQPSPFLLALQLALKNAEKAWCVFWDK